MFNRKPKIGLGYPLIAFAMVTEQLFKGRSRLAEGTAIAVWVILQHHTRFILDGRLCSSFFAYVIISKVPYLDRLQTRDIPPYQYI
jgi:hypothetical protein